MHPLLSQLTKHESPLAIIGLGYVGLPLACLFAEKYKVIGFDIDKRRINELKDGIDRTREVEDKKALLHKNLTYTTDENMLKQAKIIIVAVPTPIDEHKKPDLFPVISASETIGRNLTRGALIIYESTVYPGLTEKECKETLEKVSGLKFNKDFFLGYSPERVNPGDKLHTIEKIMKVVSGSTPEILDAVDQLYCSVIKAGTHRASSIATAEAAKVIENTQRDINIALINELSQIFERIGLDTQEVLAAAKTKWNFLDFQPGLVGGHCIGVDPYYLTYLSESVGINPQVILAGRRINDNMGKFVAEKTLRLIMQNGYVPKKRFNIAILGMTFKENIPDLRNTKVVDIIQTLEEFGVQVHCVDPVCHKDEFKEHYNRTITDWNAVPPCDAVIVAVKHQLFTETITLQEIANKLIPESPVLIDLKGLYNRKDAETMGLKTWRL